MSRDQKRRQRQSARALSKADERLAEELAQLDEDEAQTPSASAAANSGDDELDAFMVADVVEGRRVRNIQPHRILLTFAVIVALGWLLWPTFDELQFHFAEPKLVQLGNASNVARPLPQDVYAQVHGVLGNKAATVSGLRPGSLRRGPIQVRQMLGAPIYVEFDQEAHPKWSAFTEVTVKGRLIGFGRGQELRPVSDYFSQKHGMQFPADARLLVVDEAPGTMWRYPIAWGLSSLIALLSIIFLLRSMRERVVEDD